MISKHEPVALRISSIVPRSLPPARTRAPPAGGGKIHTGERWRNLRVFFLNKLVNKRLMLSMGDLHIK